MKISQDTRDREGSRVRELPHFQGILVDLKMRHFIIWSINPPITTYYSDSFDLHIFLSGNSGP
jgi:hypothetical protein